MTMSTGAEARIDHVSSAAAPSDRLEPLSDPELEALIGAATWYAKYHERMISDLADDASALAVARRARHQEFYYALAKLGVRLRRPESIAPAR
jgi:hypothetical protein